MDTNALLKALDHLIVLAGNMKEAEEARQRAESRINTWSRHLKEQREAANRPHSDKYALSLAMLRLEVDSRENEKETERLQIQHDIVTDYLARVRREIEAVTQDIVRLHNAGTEKRIQSAKSEAARKAANKRHKKTKKVKNHAIELYIKSGESNRRKAVRDMLPTLESYAAQLDWHTSDDGFPVTVYRWLSEYDREKRNKRSLPAD